MAQNTIKIISDVLKTSVRWSRAYHEGVAAAANLHSAENVVGMAENMGRSKNKLSGDGDFQIPDLFKQAPKAGGEVLTSSAEVKVEEDKNCTLPDPNSSMWNMFREAKETENAGKKLKMKFRRLKDNIKKYYIDRLEENQILFTETEEPFRIGKLDKRERVTKYSREEEMEPLVEEVQPPMMRPAMRERMNLISQNKPEEVEEKLVGENYTEMAMPEPTQPLPKGGYRNFNKADYKNVKNIEECVEPEMEVRNDRMLAKTSSEEQVKSERVYVDEEQAVTPTMWKRPQVNREKVKERGNGGLSEVVRGMTPYFGYNRVGLGSLLEPNGKRYYSTFKDTCRPPAMPPKESVCEPGEKLPKCPKPEGFQWPCCPRITLCGCDPPNPRVFRPNCGRDDLKALFAFAKRPDYICPAFSECQRNTELITKRPSECCWSKKTCDNLIGPRKPFVTALERQEISLGQNYWTGKRKAPSCYYHTSARLLAVEEADCDKETSGLPCHKPVPGASRRENKAKGGCEKICMPCCEAAREPPICDSGSTYDKEPCTKIDNPRPSFSECKKKFAMKHVICECEVPKARCPEKKMNKEGTCT